MTLEEAEEKIKEGWTITRPSWGKVVILLYVPKSYSEVTIEFIYKELDGKMLSIYIPSLEDSVVDDFELVEYRS
jgi:hypothetical protein